MKGLLKISALLNAILLAGLIVIWASRLGMAPPTPAEVSPPIQPVGTAIVSVPRGQTNSGGDSRPFRWSQLYSSDYHVYVKNLRVIGCPEPTLRAIVTADVDSVYQIITSRLEQKLADLATNSWPAQVTTANSEPALRDALQKIPSEQAAKIADLLGLKPASIANSVASAPDILLAPPLALRNLDLSALNLNADQKQIIADVREDFLQEIGDAHQDTNDPAYRARWKRAQADADNMLEAELGSNLYSQYQLAGYQNMLDSVTSTQP
jgi:hypothetical protein